MNDFVCGASSPERVLTLHQQLIALLHSAYFELRKWSSNHPAVLECIPPKHRRLQDLNFTDNADTVKIIGLRWQPFSDSFAFSVSISNTPCTKRCILSEIAKIYDPLGFLCPLILFAKRSAPLGTWH